MVPETFRRRSANLSLVEAQTGDRWRCGHCIFLHYRYVCNVCRERCSRHRADKCGLTRPEGKVVRVYAPVAVPRSRSFMRPNRFIRALRETCNSSLRQVCRVRKSRMSRFFDDDSYAAAYLGDQRALEILSRHY